MNLSHTISDNMEKAERTCKNSQQLSAVQAMIESFGETQPFFTAHNEMHNGNEECVVTFLFGSENEKSRGQQEIYVYEDCSLKIVHTIYTDVSFFLESAKQQQQMAKNENQS